VLACTLALIACGDAEEEPWRPVQQADVTVTRYPSGSASAPFLKVVGKGGQTQQFWSEAGKLTQALYTDAGRDIRVRLFVDGSGRLTRIQDERSGTFLLFSYETVGVTSSTSVVAYDSAGRFLAGQAAWRSGGQYLVAPVVGAPAFTGQIHAALSGGSRDGELIAWPLHALTRGQARPVPADVVTYLMKGPPASATTVAPSPLIAAELVGLAQLSSSGTEGARGISIGLVGAITLLGGTQIGALTVGTALAGVAPLLAVGVVVVGTLQIAEGLEVTTAGLTDLYRSAHSQFAAGKSPVEAVDQMARDIVMNARMAITEPIREVIQAATRETGALLERVENLVRPQPLPRAAAALEGELYDDAGGLVEYLSGDISSSGKVTLATDVDSGPADFQVEADVADSGQVSGTFTGTTMGQGTVAGTVEPVPTSCPPPQVLEQRRCVNPPVTCTAPAVLDNGVCVSPPVITCAPPFVMMNGMCVQAPVTCTAPQVLQDGKCVTPPTTGEITYVITRRDTNGYKLYSTSSYPGLTADGAVAKARASGPGDWSVQLVSTLPGYGAMFCVAPDGGANPAYFTAEGKATSAEAITAAKTPAVASAQGANPIRYTFICGTWHNE
jgi:hypothetical protein